MTKKIMTENEKTSDGLENLVYEIPLEQRKRIGRSNAYREEWLDCTMFWKLHFDKTFKQ